MFLLPWMTHTSRCTWVVMLVVLGLVPRMLLIMKYIVKHCLSLVMLLEVAFVFDSACFSDTYIHGLHGDSMLVCSYIRTEAMLA
jgi:hypothetical protein